MRAIHKVGYETVTFEPEVGKLVRTLKDSVNGFYKAGDEGTIVEMKDGIHRKAFVQVKFLDTNDCWWVQLGNLEEIF